VVLGADHPYSKGKDNIAEVAARTILEMRGNTPRLFRNTLVFLAADRILFQDLEEAVRSYLAWESIVADREQLDLSPHQVKQAETRRDTASDTVAARVPETYRWLLVPVQETAQAPLEWQVTRLSSRDALAVRAAKKLRNDELLVTRFAASSLRMELDTVPLWQGHHVAVKKVIQDFARYPYLPRIKHTHVLLDAVMEGVKSLAWEQDAFAYADSYDEEADR